MYLFALALCLSIYRTPSVLETRMSRIVEFTRHFQDKATSLPHLPHIPHLSHPPHPAHPPHLSPPNYHSPSGFGSLMDNLFANLLAYVRRGWRGDAPEIETWNQQRERAWFSPDVVLSSTEKAWVLHVTLTDYNRLGQLHVASTSRRIYISGDVYRPESQRIHLFKGTVELPGPESGNNKGVDGRATTCKLENGTLVITVPMKEKVECEEPEEIEISIITVGVGKNRLG
ncbi:hypothetical protein F5Y14DRAFT_196254 [Nemania sp. NC0429]|nr:hypothetical protein F5Y14DRAFT_196254 [Nemania sp. NC0429]